MRLIRDKQYVSLAEVVDEVSSEGSDPFASDSDEDKPRPRSDFDKSSKSDSNKPARIDHRSSFLQR